MENPTPSFMCAVCGGTFLIDRSEAEAEAEFRENFGRDKREDDAVICDACYQKMVAIRPPSPDYG